MAERRSTVDTAQVTAARHRRRRRDGPIGPPDDEPTVGEVVPVS